MECCFDKARFTVRAAAVSVAIVMGAGADYRIWKELYVGVDARYHRTSGRNDGIKINGVTAGGYLGVGF